MRRFQFSLQAALSLRERAVDAAKAAFLLVQTEWNNNQRRQQDLLDEVRSAELAIPRDSVDSSDLLALDRFRTASHRRRLRLAREATAIAARLAEKQKLLQNAERDHTLLLRLKEKAQSRWNFDYEKEQQQLAEEAYISRWNSR